MSKYNVKELRKVMKFCSKNGIKGELDTLYDGWQFGVPCLPRNGDCAFDVIIHSGSYGHMEGLLEVMGVIVNEKEVGDTVEGWLNSDMVIDRIKKYYIGA